MNVFVLDKDPAVAAKYHVDKHVVKMIVETAQLLCTAHRVCDGTPLVVQRKRKHTEYVLSDTRNDILYKASFVNHPCNVWARETKQNYEWLSKLGVCLVKEYTHRYHKLHKTEPLIQFLHDCTPKNIKDEYLTPFAQAMPDQYKNPNAVQAYRDYYMGEKKRFATWKTQIPYWWDLGEVNDTVSTTTMV